MRPQIYIVELIGSGFLAVMAKPVSGEWIEDEFRGIAHEGVHQIVSLLEQQEAYEVGLHDEKALTEKNGMEFVSFPIQDRGLPHSVKEFKNLIMHLYHQIAGGKNTVIHCRAGIGRTGVVAAGLLIQCGFDPDQALTHISRKRGVQVPDTIEQRDWLLAHHNELTRRT
jgi:protein-tyrosine phosphatase